MAIPKRLNEIDKPVINFGQADDFHKLVLPSNTTTNLAAITPKDIGSLAYDTTLNEVVVNNGSAFVAVAAGGAVTSVATGTGLTGGPITSTGTVSLANTAVTLGSYTNASITVDQQGRLTSASSGNQIIPFTSSAGVGGSSSEALVVTGLLASDTLLSVSQKTAGTNSLPLLGWTLVANNALTVQWSANPGAGSIVVVAVKR